MKANVVTTGLLLAPLLLSMSLLNAATMEPEFDASSWCDQAGKANQQQLADLRTRLHSVIDRHKRAMNEAEKLSWELASKLPALYTAEYQKAQKQYNNARTAGDSRLQQQMQMRLHWLKQLQNKPANTLIYLDLDSTRKHLPDNVNTAINSYLSSRYNRLQLTRQYDNTKKAVIPAFDCIYKREKVFGELEQAADLHLLGAKMKALRKQMFAKRDWLRSQTRLGQSAMVRHRKEYVGLAKQYLHAANAFEAAGGKFDPAIQQEVSTLRSRLGK